MRTREHNTGLLNRVLVMSLLILLPASALAIAGPAAGAGSPEVYMCGRSVMYNWFSHWGDGGSGEVTRDGYALHYRAMNGPEDYPPIADTFNDVVDGSAAGANDAFFFKFCFVDFAGGDQATAQDNLNRNKAIVDQVVAHTVNTRHEKLIIGNALPSSVGATEEWLNWNHLQYNAYLQSVRAAHPNDVFVFDFFSRLSVSGAAGGGLNPAYDQGDGHPNDAGYDQLDAPFFALLGTVFSSTPPTPPTPPPDPADFRSVFYFAEGYTGGGFQEYLCVANPTAAAATVWVRYMFTDGTVQDSSYGVGASSRLTVNVNDAVGAGRELGMRVGSTTAGLVAERPMYFDYNGWTGGHDVIGAPALAPRWYFAEGNTRQGFDEWVTVMNPQGSEAHVTFRYMVAGEGEVVRNETVGANSRATFKTAAHIGEEKDASLLLESDLSVVAERPMYFDYHGAWNGGHCVIGANAPAGSWSFAEGTTREGFEEWLCLQNPGDSEITVDATYLLGAGQGPSQDRSYRVPAKERVTVSVNAAVGAGKDVSVILTSGSEFIAERPMYFDYNGAWDGGHDVLGATAAAGKWYFAEGYTGDGFQEWLCLQNPGAQDADVTITYYPEGGSAITRDHAVPANSRVTVNVNDDAGPDLSISALVESNRAIVAERPMYFDYHGWTGGHDVVGYPQ